MFSNFVKFFPFSLLNLSTEKPANIVDANLNVLRQRIEEVKRKERFNACYTLKSEWCYQSGYDHRHKRDAMLSQSIELFALGTGAIGLVFLIGSLCICLVSLLTCSLNILYEV